MHYYQISSGCFGTYKDSQQSSKSYNIELPLKKFHHFVQIINGVAEVEMHQTYVNKCQKFIEIQYKFPIMSNICLHKFVAIFGKTRMEGVVKQKEAAKVEYKQAVNSGKKAAIGTIDPQTKDTITLQIGNIGPSEQVKIQICYSQQLSISLNIFYQFNFATRLLPKFVKNISKEDYLNAFRNNLKIGESEFQWDYRLKLKASRKVIVHKSPTHQLTIEKNNDQNTQIEFTFSKGEYLSKKFIFLYTTEEFQIPSYTLGRTDISSSVMVSFIPKFCTLDLKDAQLAALKPESFETDIAGVKGQYIFLLDRSGSMGGSPIQKAKQALVMFLKSLPVDSFFQVVSFGTKHQFLFPQSRKNSNQYIDYAIKIITQWKANMGGTEIYQPLSQLLKSKLIEGYPKQVFLLTDGDVSDKNGVLELIRKNTKYTRVHAIGVGNDVSKSLIIGCAEKGKGQHVFISNGEDPSEKIIQLLNDSLTPIISKVSLEYDSNLIESIVPNPARLPYILKGEVVNFYLTFKGHLRVPTFISLSYTDSLNGLPFKSLIQVLPDSPSEAFVDKMGNFRRIKALEEAEENNADIEQFLYFAKAVDRTQQIIELSTKHQILSKYTAFLCIQKELVDGRYQEIKDKGKQKIYIQDKVVQDTKKINKGLFDDDEDDIFSLKPSSSTQNASYHLNPNSSLPAANTFGFGFTPSYVPIASPNLPPPLMVPPPPPPAQNFSFAQNTKQSNNFIVDDFFNNAPAQRSYNPSPPQINNPAPIKAPLRPEYKESLMKKPHTIISNDVDFSEFFGKAQHKKPMMQQKNDIKKQLDYESFQKSANQQTQKKKTFNNLFGLGNKIAKSDDYNSPKVSIQNTSMNNNISSAQPPGQNQNKFILDLMDLPNPSSLPLPPPPFISISAPPPPISSTKPSNKPNYSDDLLLQFLSPPPPSFDIIDLSQSNHQFNFEQLPPPPPPPLSFIHPPAQSSGITKEDLLKQISQPNLMSCLKNRIKNRSRPLQLFDDSDQDAPYVPSLPKVQINLQSISSVSMPFSKDPIKEIVSQQQYEGKWSNIKLIELLFGVNLANEVQQLAQKELVITLLLTGWIEKYHKEKVYSLILKKAQSWLKKQEKYHHYQQHYEKYIR